ncbi:efflux RND transporter periplasmic adaptor subunit, partial [Pseudonocardia benzenivorans]
MAESPVEETAPGVAGAADTAPIGAGPAAGGSPPGAGAARRRALAPRSWSRRVRWIVVAAVVVVVVGVVLAVTLPGSSAGPAPTLVRAQVGTLRTTVGATGTIAPAQRADLDFGVSGQVTSVSVTVGQQVAAGATLATVDSAGLPGQVAQANASVASAQAKVDADSGASAAQRNADAAALSAAQAQLAVARRNLSQATLTAPFAGTVAAVNVTAGQQVSGGGSAGGSSGGSSGTGSAVGGGGGAGAGGGSSAAGSSSATADVVVISTGTFVVNATVDDTEVASLKAGQSAQVVPTGTTTPVAATVSTVGLVASSSSGVASYPVTLTVTGDASSLRAGETAQVTITTSQTDGALLVPSAAVRGSGANASVLVDSAGSEKTVPVQVGATDGARTQILSGITAGTEVVVPT